MENKDIRPPSLWTRNFVLIVLSAIFMGITNQMLYPTLPVYLAGLGIDKSLAGTMTTSFAFGSMMFRPFAGRFTDTRGRKNMLIAGLVCATAAGVSYMLFSNFYLLLAIRVIHGLSLCLCSTAAGALVVDIIPRERLVEGIGFYGISGAVTQTLGPALAISLQEKIGMWSVFLSAAVFTGSAIVTAMMVEQPQPTAGTIPPAGAVRKGFIEPTAVIPAAMIFLVSFCHSTLATFLALYGREIQMPGMGNFFMVISVGIIGTRLFLGRLTAKFGEGRVIVSAVGVAALCFVGVGLARSYLNFMGIALIYGFGYGILYPLLNSMSMRYAQPENRGSATATFLMAYDAGLFAGTIVWGKVSAGLSYSTMYFAAGGILLLIAAIYKFVYAKKYPEVSV